MTPNNAYRPEIDGLRAIAVLAVLFFHLDPSWAPGGYVGVDVFFVISGFLITAIIVRSQAESRFSFYDFYLRRIRRIAPTYFAVVLASLVAGYVLMQQADLKQLAAAAGWSAISLPNVYVWQHLDTSYFAADSRQLPLLHLWSLGVEEQFYLIWPLMLLAGLRWLPRNLLPWSLLALIVASFTYAQQQSVIDPKFAYYMLPTRAGELAIGGLLALFPAVRNARRSDHPLFEAVALAGVGLIIGSIWTLDGNSRFPGWNALPGCLGAALVILADSQRHCLVLAPLRSRLMVGIGLVSYSLYLWHWPVLAFLRYLSIPFNPIAAGAAILVLAFLSYWFIERRTRHLRMGKAKQVVLLAIIPALVIIGLSMTLDHRADRKIEKQQRANLENASKQRLRQTAAAYEFPYNCQLGELDTGVLSRPLCVHGKPADRPADILLWGDSHASHHVGVLGAIADANHLRIRNASLSTCPPVWGAEPYGTGTFQAGCSQFRPFIQRNLAPYRTVILGASWSVHRRNRHFDQDLRNTLAELTGAGKSVVLLAQAPGFPDYDRNCEVRQTGHQMLNCEAVASRPDSDEAKDINRFLTSLAADYPNTYVLDIHDLLCRQGRCSPYLDGRPMYFDSEHLSMEGSWQLGARLLASGAPLPPPLQAGP